MAATSKSQLMRAWLNVKPRVESSSDETVRKSAASFAANPDLEIARLQRRLRSGTFVFEPQKAVLKRKKVPAGAKPKPPRPIVVAPVLSRIVQRSILDVCQTQDPQVTRRLGEIPKMLATPTSVGGLPRKGVPEGIELIAGAIASGAKWFVRSDLVGFFQNIPKPLVRAFLEMSIKDKLFVDLFMNALSTELENEEEVRASIGLFPLGDIGVPQGSALSALCGNIVLSQFDTEMNARGIVTVRYLDDFVILGSNKKKVDAAWQSAVSLLSVAGLQCHDPRTRNGKASRGEISSGFEFLGYSIAGSAFRPTRDACVKLIEEMNRLVSDAKRGIATSRDTGRRAERRYIQFLDLLDRKIRGWGHAYSKVNDRLIFAQLDTQIDKVLKDFASWFNRHKRTLDARQYRRALGIALLSDTPLPVPIL